MTSRIDLKRGFLAALTAVAVAFALVLVAAGSPASADSPNTWPISSDANQASFWVAWGADTHGETDWTCVKDDDGSEGPFVLGGPPEGSFWRLLVVKAGSTSSDLHWNPVSGQSFGHSQQGGWSHVILCSRPIPTTDPPPTDPTVPPTEPPTDSTTPTTIPDEVSPTSIVSTTIPDEVSPTTIVSTTDPEVSPETLPFTGFENGTSGLLALVLVASGALALVGTRVFRKETDE